MPDKRLIPAYAKRMHRVGSCYEHNCIPISVWFRHRWVCVRCDGIFKLDMSGQRTPIVSRGQV